MVTKIEIFCDCCKNRICDGIRKDLSEFIRHLVENFADMIDPDLCQNCLNKLHDFVEKAVIEWKL